MKPEEARINGKEKFTNHDYESAAVIYNKALTEGQPTQEEAALLKTNLAACRLKQEKWAECRALCNEILDTDPKMTKARWRRSLANGGDGQQMLKIIDLQILHLLEPKNKEIKTTLNQAITDTDQAHLDAIHKRLLTHDEIHNRFPEHFTHQEIAAFYQHSGEVTLLYLLTSPCVASILQGAAISASAVRNAPNEYMETHNIKHVLVHLLRHPSGNIVRKAAAKILFMLLHSTTTPVTSTIVDPTHVLWECVCGLLSNGDAPKEAVEVGYALSQRTEPIQSRYFEMMCYSGILLWTNPKRCSSTQDLRDSMRIRHWRGMFLKIGSISCFQSLRKALIGLTKYNSAVVSSEAATLIGTMEEILHPDDHCNMEDVVLPVEEVEPSCPNCLAPNPPLYCGTCKLFQYCSEECQKQDWFRHRQYCA